MKEKLKTEMSQEQTKEEEAEECHDNPGLNFYFECSNKFDHF